MFQSQSTGQVSMYVCSLRDYHLVSSSFPFRPVEGYTYLILTDLAEPVINVLCFVFPTSNLLPVLDWVLSFLSSNSRISVPFYVLKENCSWLWDCTNSKEAQP